MECTSTPPEVTKTIAQLKIRITEVLIAVARLELRPETPILASRAVIPAKKAEDSAKKNHCIFLEISEQQACSSKPTLGSDLNKNFRSDPGGTATSPDQRLAHQC